MQPFNAQNGGYDGRSYAGGNPNFSEFGGGSQSPGIRQPQQQYDNTPQQPQQQQFNNAQQPQLPNQGPAQNNPAELDPPDKGQNSYQLPLGMGGNHARHQQAAQNYQQQMQHPWQQSLNQTQHFGQMLQIMQNNPMFQNRFRNLPGFGQQQQQSNPYGPGQNLPNPGGMSLNAGQLPLFGDPRLIQTV